MKSPFDGRFFVYFDEKVYNLLKNSYFVHNLVARALLWRAIFLSIGIFNKFSIKTLCNLLS